MKDRGKLRWGRRRKRGAAKEAAEKSADSPPSSDTPPPTAASAPAIRKGIYLSALIYVEGEHPPADNFDSLATSTLKDALAPALKDDHEGLKMTLKRIEPRNDIETDEGEADKEEKFSF